jgi:hypothetical protein
MILVQQREAILIMLSTAARKVRLTMAGRFSLLEIIINQVALSLRHTLRASELPQLFNLKS